MACEWRASQEKKRRGRKRRRAPLPDAKRHVRDLWPVSLQIEQRCGRFLRERPTDEWSFRCGLLWCEGRGGLRSRRGGLQLPSSLLADDAEYFLEAGRNMSSAWVQTSEGFGPCERQKSAGGRRVTKLYSWRRAMLTIRVLHRRDRAADDHRVVVLLGAPPLAEAVGLLALDVDGRRGRVAELCANKKREKRREREVQERAVRGVSTL